MTKQEMIMKSYEIAKERYKGIGIDTDKVLEKLAKIPVSIHCWQGDDVAGFENEGALTGGIQATGNYLGKARNGEELRRDIEKALSMIPGKHRLNLHSIYADYEGEKIERNRLEPKHFERWIEWAKKNVRGLDFNPSLFSHKNADDGLTLSHPDERIRNYWIEHCIASRKVAEYFGKELGTPSVNNIWIPDGYKDIAVDKYEPRKRLMDSLDKIFAEKLDEKYILDSVESKVFGIGSEAYVVGSHEFYMGYAMKNKKLLCLDSGHFHPTEMISGKISSLMLYLDKILLHVSRPMRWDSDHVVILDDELNEIAKEIVRNDFIDRTCIGLDFFDASINRIAAWVIGTRNMIKALLIAHLEPTEHIRKCEAEGDFTSRLALLEEYKTYPFGAVWDYYCMKNSVPVGEEWLSEVKKYEEEVLKKRG